MTSSSILMLAICAGWLPPLPLSGRLKLPLWLPLLLAATVLGILAGQIDVLGVAGLLLLGLCAFFAARMRARLQGELLLTLAILLALALALHRWPGFANPLVLARQAITPDALPFALYANFDKGAAGLLLLALLCPRSRAWRDWWNSIGKAILPGLITIAAVMGLGWAIGFVRPEPKWPPFALQFLSVNLLLTVVAEEAFFRGIIQHRLADTLNAGRTGAIVSIAVSALLFGASHLGGGLAYAALATLAGIGYAIAFHRSGRIEGAILAHFGLNAVHFVCFTYPKLA